MNRDIDQIIQRVQQSFPTVEFWQLAVKYPGADDDGLWFFTLPDAQTGKPLPKDIQIESPDGMCPFLVEHSGMASAAEAETARSIDEAVEKVCAYLASLQSRSR